ncbi:hypothetical protein N665_0132s0001 [Sinapis alba]|nr:hypothetical protein N665_0132s0001 [Sinapis alba]
MVFMFMLVSALLYLPEWSFVGKEIEERCYSPISLEITCRKLTFYGIKGGPDGIMKCKYLDLDAKYTQRYRNQCKRYD